MRKSYCFLTVFLLAALFSISANSQTITIRGNVKNGATKENVPAVTIGVKGTNDRTYTDPNGDFSIRVSKLPVTLEISSVGFEHKEVNVTDASQPANIDLAVVAIPGTDVIVYSTQRTPQRILEAPVTVERLSSSDLRNTSSSGYYEAINNLKGVDMHTASITFRTVTTRGFVKSGNTRMNQLIDGMDNQAPGLNFSVGNIIGLTELDVDNIELLSGATSALYGSGGMNGTLLLTSKNPFKYQGLSFNVKQGIMHTDGKQRSPAPYYDWSFRYAKNIKDKFAFKVTMQLVKASDWQANDYRNTDRSGILSKVVGGDRNNSPGYDGVNVYGDETNANIFLVAPALRDGIRAAFQVSSGINLQTQADAYFASIGNPQYPTTAQINTFISAFPAAAQPTVGFWLPFYNAVKGGYIPQNNSIVSRTGYEEKTLVDYNTLNVKGTVGLHWKITPATEASWTSYLGTGTTVYTGADRYSLRNFKMAQHKLEVRSKNWLVRGYTTQENAGEAYNGTVLGRFLNEYWKPSINLANPSASWYPQYIYAYSEAIRNGGNNGVSIANAHLIARATADVGRLLPGTQTFEDAKKTVRSTPIPGGAKFLDKSDLWAGEGQLNFSDLMDFSDMIEVIAGIQYKQYVLKSQGTIFNDAAGPIKVNETGGYVQLKKKLGEVVTLTAAGRYDKHKNYDGRFTPRFTATFKVAKNNYIRASYQQAYRFPTNQDQYINLNVGSGILVGHLDIFKDMYDVNNPNRKIYTATSVIAARAALNPGLLVQANWLDVKPETVSSYEIGYKGIINKVFSLDAYAYRSEYKDFLANVAVGQSNQTAPTVVDLLDPTKTRNLSYAQNTPGTVKAFGWGLGLEYKFLQNKEYYLYGNVFSDELHDVPSGFIAYFNAPKYRFNVGLRNDKVWKGLGFNVVVKWQDDNFYEGTFVTGTLPSFTWVDAQISWRPANSKSIFRVGGTNVGNNYARTGFGSPYVGGLYYVSYGYNIF
jgi:outer membrane receptor protein involved in Fe transport